MTTFQEFKAAQIESEQARSKHMERCTSFLEHVVTALVAKGVPRELIKIDPEVPFVFQQFLHTKIEIDNLGVQVRLRCLEGLELGFGSDPVRQYDRNAGGPEQVAEVILRQFTTRARNSFNAEYGLQQR